MTRRDVDVDGGPPLVGPDSIDVVLRAPRTVSVCHSLLLAAGRTGEADAAAAAHREATAAALDRLDREAAYGVVRDPYTRRAVEWVACGELSTWLQHHTTAPADRTGPPAPDLHTHVLVDPVVQRPDRDDLLDLDIDGLRRELEVAGILYDRTLGELLSRVLAARMVRPSPGSRPEMAGIPADLVLQLRVRGCVPWPIARQVVLPLTASPPDGVPPE